jgi:DNA-directed RNA polymerase subunit RPC12/RpoP
MRLSAADPRFNPFDEPPIFPGGKPKMAYRPYRCMNCGHEQSIQTNHLGKVIAYCENCSWKPSFGKPEYAIPFNGRTYRPFEYAGTEGGEDMRLSNRQAAGKRCNVCRTVHTPDSTGDCSQPGAIGCATEYGGDDNCPGVFATADDLEHHVERYHGGR